jgi:hypothetical protein
MTDVMRTDSCYEERVISRLTNKGLNFFLILSNAKGEIFIIKINNVALGHRVSAMGIFDLFRGSNDGWMTSKDLEVGKDYKYMAEYADRRRKGVTSCRTLKRKAKSKYMKAKRHDFDMWFDMGGDKRDLFFVRTDKPIFKSCKRRRRRS